MGVKNVEEVADVIRIKHGLQSEPALAVLSRALLNGNNQVVLDVSGCETPAEVLELMGIGVPVLSRKTQDQSVTASTTLVDCTGISAELEANSVYHCEFCGTMTVGGGGMDGKFVVPTDAQAFGCWFFNNISGNIYKPAAEPVTTETLIVQSSGGQPGGLVVPFLVVTAGTAGTLKLQFAQNSSNGTASTIHAGSWLKVQKMP